MRQREMGEERGNLLEQQQPQQQQQQSARAVLRHSCGRAGGREGGYFLLAKSQIAMPVSIFFLSPVSGLPLAKSPRLGL